MADLDWEIEKQTGKSPRALYTEGVEGFRAAETAALERVLNAAAAAPESAPAVLACGGGIIDNAAALTLLDEHKSRLKIVFLEISAAAAWERLAACGGELPPFLQTAANPKATHRALHRRRGTAYKKIAALTVNAEGKTPEQIAREIAARCYMES
jgi:shikimate kinase